MNEIGPQEKAVLVQLGIIQRALAVLLVKRFDYSGTADPFMNFDDPYFPEDGRAKNAWKRLGDKMRRIANHIRGQIAGESIFYNDLPDSINYLSGIIGPLLVSEADESVEQDFIDRASQLEATIRDIIAGAQKADAANRR